MASDHWTPAVGLPCHGRHQLDLPDNYFDVVTRWFTLHFLDDPETAISKAHRVLRPGGLFAFSGPPTNGPADEEPEGPSTPHDDCWAFYRELISDMASRTSALKKPDPFTSP
ncbi:class I SAM-dependent methyltransferase [Streptomyces sp. DW4-2]|uniref:Class I SAM-dependent methyltransferase n=1 Tax=Streptomyces spirodelae TaxID=2812904 RepID=A0ABS3X0I3_9ACTN|nr:class I SAM-dependent methyltransferase [Streptomyces spirodelae]MBO8188844.1 class I SAM-dependent methyltransferase [Streptomyces spirodelae]